ncbi:MAG: diacylglycerol/lipid kinase family protein [Rubricoccaceae bacterium]
MRYAFILNPAARSGRAARLRGALAEGCRAHGLDARFAETRAPGDARALAHVLARDADVVVAVGGDGTVGEVVEGLLAPGARGTARGTARRAALGVVPAGTGNDFAAHFGFPQRLAGALDVLRAAQRRPLDVLRLRGTSGGAGGGQAWERVVVNGLGLGFDAAAAAGAGRFKRLGGHLAYLASVLSLLRTWAPPPLRVALTAEPGGPPCPLWLGPTFLLELGNGSSVGGGFRLTPDADPADGRLDVCLVREVPVWRVLRLLPRVFSGGHVGAPEVTMARGACVTVEALGAPVPAHLDGEDLPGGLRRLEASVLPAALALVAPPSRAPARSGRAKSQKETSL